MNKILNINLGGYAITIDDDAYEYLLSYLESIRKRFSESEGRDEIVHDIETRIGELISQSMGNRTIVMLPDVEAATEVMGKPEDFGGESTTGSTANTGSSSGSSNNAGSGSGGRKGSAATSSIRTGKRLFRDEEDTVAGGVCSGLSAYFGIHDPLWMRLIFVLLTFLSTGFWMLAYLLLWILVPPAKSAADRLAMRGEPINVDNIAREIEDSFERLSTRVNDYGKEKKSGDRSFGNAMSAGVSVLGQMFAFVVRLFAKFGIFIAAIVAVSLFIALAVSWVAGIWGLLAAAPFVDYFSPYSSGLTWLGFANAFFLLGIPVVGLCLVFARALFKVRTPGWLSAGLGFFWFINMVMAVFLVGFAAKGYRQGGTKTTDIDLSGLRSDTLRVTAADAGMSGESYWWFDSDDGLRINDDRLEFKGLVEIRVQKSADGAFHCKQIIRARGTSTNDAISNAQQTEFPVSFSDNTLRVPTFFGILKGQKWRGQHVRLNIEVPTGKNIVFDEKIHRYAAADLEEYADDNDRQYISRSPDKVFRMTNRGLICSECPQFGDSGYHGDEYYEHFILEGKFETEIRRGNDFKLTIEGPSGAIQKIRTGNKLTLTTKGGENGAVKVYIETPVITSLYADDTGDVTIRGFEEGEASISAKGSSHIKAYIDVSNDLNVTLSGKSFLELIGEGGSMDAGLSDGATLEALGWRAERVEITASENSKGRVFAKEDALIINDGSSEVKVEGGARIRNTRYEK